MPVTSIYLYPVGLALNAIINKVRKCRARGLMAGTSSLGRAMFCFRLTAQHSTHLGLALVAGEHWTVKDSDFPWESPPYMVDIWR